MTPNVLSLLPLSSRRATPYQGGGDVVLITGAAGALGAATARLLATRGTTLALADLDKPRVEALAVELAASGAEAVAFPCDVLDDDALDALIADVVARFGAVDVFVSSAGVEINAAFHTVTTAEIDQQLGLHLRSPMLIVNKLLGGMLERKHGHIVIISSQSGKVPLPVKAPYAAAKAGSVAFSHSLRRELEGTGVTVSVVTPGVVTGAGQAHRALTGSSVAIPRALSSVTVGEVASAIVEVLGTGASERPVQHGPGFLVSGLQAAAPNIADRLLKRTGIGEFWRAVARENGRD